MKPIKISKVFQANGPYLVPLESIKEDMPVFKKINEPKATTKLIQTAFSKKKREKK